MRERIKKWAQRLKVDLSALYLAYKRQDLPWYAKVAALAAVGYALSPVDLIPDFIPILGYVDDLLILPLLIFIAIKCIPENIMTECRDQAQDMWQRGKPKSWKYAIPIVVVWLALVVIVVKLIWF